MHVLLLLTVNVRALFKQASVWGGVLCGGGQVAMWMASLQWQSSALLIAYFLFVHVIVLGLIQHCSGARTAFPLTPTRPTIVRYSE